MIRLLMRATLVAATVGVIGPAQAQIAAAPVVPPQWPPAAYPASTFQYYPSGLPTPDDAYRDGLINRWELEGITGPLPQAMQGPSVNGTRGGDAGGDKN